MTQTKTNKPITMQNDAELRTSTNTNTAPTPIAYDDVLESTGTKYSFPEVFEQVDDQHTRVPGTDPSTKGAPSHTSTGGLGRQGAPIAMSRDIASLGGPTDGYAYADEFGTQEMYRKEPTCQTLSVNDDSINLGSKSAGNRAANVTQRKAIGTASTGTYDKASRN